MHKLIGWYLVELEARLKGRIPENRLREVLGETESHLAESVEQLSREGDASPEATALKRFGDLDEVADALEPDRRWLRFAIVAVAAVTVALPGLVIFLDRTSDSLSRGGFILAVMALLALLWVHGRLAIGTLATGAALGTAALTMVFWQYSEELADPNQVIGGTRITARSQESLQILKDRMYSLDQAERYVRAAMSDIESTPRPSQIRLGRYAVPASRGYNEYEPVPLEFVDSADEARRQWAEEGPGILRSIAAQKSEVGSTIAMLSSVRRPTLLRFYSEVGWSFLQYGLGTMALLWAANLVIARLSRLKRPRRRLVMN